MQTSDRPKAATPHAGGGVETPMTSASGQPLPLILLRAMRPQQWSKNVLLFAGLLFSGKFLEPQLILKAFYGFLLFCLFSSCIYLINDLRDRDRDRLNPRTARRPIASGALKPSIALGAIVVMLPVAFILSYLLNPWFAFVGAIYIAKDLGYSFGLKHVVIVDVFLIAAGFVLRAVAGALAIGVQISPWLYVVTTLGALFLALNKRKHEILLLSADAGSHRKVLDEYSPALIEEMLAVVTASTVMAYALYTFTAENLPPRLRENHLMMLTVPFVLYGIFRYLYLVYQKNEGSTPEEVLFRDKPLLVCILLWGLTAASLLLYFGNYLK
jgi:4-hydroxybenzoate polyprenyltransferase